MPGKAQDELRVLRLLNETEWEDLTVLDMARVRAVATRHELTVFEEDEAEGLNVVRARLRRKWARIVFRFGSRAVRPAVSFGVVGMLR